MNTCAALPFFFSFEEKSDLISPIPHFNFFLNFIYRKHIYAIISE